MAKQKLKKIILVLLFVLFLFNSAHGETFDVSSVEQIQSALDAAAHNGQDDVINIAAGTYSVTDTLTYVQGEAFSLILQGAGMDKTILDGGGAVRVMAVDTTQTDTDVGTSVTVNAVAFQNGYTEIGGGAGLNVKTRIAYLIVEQSAFLSNKSFPPHIPGKWPQWEDAGGGGLFVGAGVKRNEGGVTIQNCLFRDNQSTVGGGAYIWATDYLFPKVKVINNIFDNNTATYAGGGFWAYTKIIYVINNTLINNTSEGDGGGISLYSGMRADIFNNIAWANNATGRGSDLYINDEGYQEYINVYNNTYTDVVFSEGNTHSEAQTSNADPLVEADYSLNEQSQCINTGDGSAPELSAKDFRSNNRISGASVDRGAIEYGSTPETEPTDASSESSSDPAGETSPVEGSGGSGCFIGAMTESAQGSKIDPDSRAYRAAKRVAEKHNSPKAQEVIKKQMERLQPLVAKQKAEVHQGVCAENQPSTDKGQTEILIFISGSMPAGVISSFVGETSKLDCNTKYILAGHPKMGVDPFSQTINPAGRKLDLHIDPLMFDAYEVEEVPVLVVNRRVKINHPESIKSALIKSQTNAKEGNLAALIKALSYGE